MKKLVILLLFIFINACLLAMDNPEVNSSEEGQMATADTKIKKTLNQSCKQICQKLELSLTREQWARNDTGSILVNAYFSDFTGFFKNGGDFWKVLRPEQKQLIINLINSSRESS